jgi:hypothetical protein
VEELELEDCVNTETDRENKGEYVEELELEVEN